MFHEGPWAADAKVIEIEPFAGDLGDQLACADYANYLAITSSPALAAAIEQRHPALRGKVVVSSAASRSRRNNADVLIFNGWTVTEFAYWRGVAHAEWLAVRLRFHPVITVALAIGVVLWGLGFVGRPTLVTSSTSARKLVVWRNRRRRRACSARRYIPYQLSVAGFLGRLRDDNRRHAVLRWFETLPAVAPGEDLDLLIDDVELTEVERLLESGPGVQAVDVYTVTGLPGTDFRSLPYYPPALARTLLDDACEHAELCRVPSPEHYFLSLAYHALYHKGLNSGLPANDSTQNAAPSRDHDYAAILGRLGAAVGYHGPITLESLDDHLSMKGWRPSHDMMARLARHNDWLRTRLAEESGSEGDNGLAVFLLREQGLLRGGVERARNLLEGQGFRAIHANRLSPAEAALATQVVRGGNWGPGPWPASGGSPAAIIVAYDCAPIPLNRRQRKKYPFAVNARTLCKDHVRDEFNRDVPEHKHCNVIHSSDNGREAMEYIRAIYAERASEVFDAVEKLKGDANASREVLADVTKSGRRAKIEIVRYRDQIVVKKTFKPQMLHFLEREVRFLTELSGKIPSLPPLVARGESWFMIPYYRDALSYRRSSGKLLPVDVARQAIQALREVYDAGYALIDASIDNLLVDRQEGLKLFDFEFSHRYERRPDCFEQSYDIAGCPVDFQGDLPVQGSNSYDRNWRPYVGLSLPSLLNDPSWLQQVKRAFYFATHVHQFLPRLARGFVRRIFSVQASNGLPTARLESEASHPQPLRDSSKSSKAA